MADHLTPERRSWNMSRIKGMDTGPELKVRNCAYKRGLRYRTHVTTLPGRPDMVFPSIKVAVFIDGDFWHGYRFSSWSDRLSEFWRAKIERNRKRDQTNFRKLRCAGWLVLRVWEHEVKKDVEECVDRIANAVTERKKLLLTKPGRAK